MFDCRTAKRKRVHLQNTFIQTLNAALRRLYVNSQNLTHDMILRTGNSIFRTDDAAPFELFKHFGFRSGRDYDKLTDMITYRRGKRYSLPSEYTNAYFTLK